MTTTALSPTCRECCGFTFFIFHVPWTDTPERVQVIGELIDQLKAGERIWFAPSGEIAD